MPNYSQLYPTKPRPFLKLLPGINEHTTKFNNATARITNKKIWTYFYNQK